MLVHQRVMGGSARYPWLDQGGLSLEPGDWTGSLRSPRCRRGGFPPWFFEVFHGSWIPRGSCIEDQHHSVAVQTRQWQKLVHHTLLQSCQLVVSSLLLSILIIMFFINAILFNIVISVGYHCRHCSCGHFTITIIKCVFKFHQQKE